MLKIILAETGEKMIVRKKKSECLIVLNTIVVLLVYLRLVLSVQFFSHHFGDPSATVSGIAVRSYVENTLGKL